MASSTCTVDVCPVCLDGLVDARILPCLHSACRACIDRIVVTSADGVVKCSMCRASVQLPPGGAAALAKDVQPVSSLGGCESLECGLCVDDKTRKKATLWCRKCSLAFCESHGGTHVLSASRRGEVHIVVPLNTESSREGLQSPDIVPTCPHHNEPLKFHCGACNIAICGDCTAIGSHRLHGPVRYVKDIVDERKQQVAQKVDTLEGEFAKKLERSLKAVDQVSTELVQRAQEVRTDIRQAGERAVQMVEAHVQQMVQEVDDLEESRLKVLDRQKDELKTCLDSARSAVRFKDRIMQLSVGGETLFPLLHALETRATGLLSTEIQEEPRHHSRIKFSPANNLDLASKTKEGIGKVIPCRASAKHSVIESGTALTTQRGTALSVRVVTKDRDGSPLTVGGDDVTTRCTTEHGDGEALLITTTDNEDGSYTFSVSARTRGRARAEIFVNGEKMSNDLEITVAAEDQFDRNECHPLITVSEDGQRVTNGRSSWNSVLGSTPMSHGQYSWRMKSGENSHYMIGIAPKPSPTSHRDDFNKVAYCWLINRGSVYVRDFVRCSHHRVDASAANNLQLDLDCDRHTLRITNLDSGQTSTLSHLPKRRVLSVRGHVRIKIFRGICIGGCA